MKKGDKIKVYDSLGKVIEAVYWAKQRFNHHHVKIQRPSTVGYARKKGYITTDWYISSSRIVGMEVGPEGENAKKARKKLQEGHQVGTK